MRELRQQGDDQCALAAGVGPTARLCLHEAEADDVHKSLRHPRIELLLMPWADATPTIPIKSSQAKQSASLTP